jgi:hypothetical protein
MEDLNELIEVAREAAFFIRSIDGYENSKLASKLSSLADKVEGHKLLAIGRLAARVVYRNSKKAVEQSVQRTAERSPRENVVKVENDPRCLATGGIRRR